MSKHLTSGLTIRRGAKQHRGWSLLATLLLAVVHLVVPARAQIDRLATTQTLINRLVLEHASTIASVRRQADEQEAQRLIELASADRRLRSETRLRVSAESELAAVTAERQSLIDTIAERDRRFFAEIEEYRRQVASIADSPDPRKRAALERYADGAREVGFTTLVEIQRADTRAVAAGWRELAALAEDRKDRGEMSTTEVIDIYREAIRLDADDHTSWVKLSGLHMEAGQLPEARRAAEESVHVARDDRDRLIGLSILGDVLIAQGVLGEARARFADSLSIAQRLASANVTSAMAQFDVAAILLQMGTTLVTAGALADGRAHFEESLAIFRRLAVAVPTNREVQRGVGRSLERLGQVLVSEGMLADARHSFVESLAIYRRLAVASPTSAAAQRDVGVNLELLGHLSIEERALTDARAFFEESLAIFRRLAEADPTNSVAQREVGVSLEGLGTALAMAGQV